MPINLPQHAIGNITHPIGYDANKHMLSLDGIYYYRKTFELSGKKVVVVHLNKKIKQGVKKLITQTTKQPIKQNTKHARLFETSFHKCYYCKKELTDDNRTRDHIKPFSKGGKLNPNNKVYACRECNQLKGPYTLIEFNARLLETICFLKTKKFDHFRVRWYEVVLKNVVILIQKLK